MSNYTSYSGEKYILGKVLGEGGEGKVYEICGNSDIAAKIYRDDRFRSFDERSAKERKLKTMINMNIPVRIDEIVRLVWPIDILYQNDLMVGFVLPVIRERCSLFDVQHADPCWQHYDQHNPFVKAYPEYTWKYLVLIAYNLAWIVNYMHSKGIVIGCLNPNSIIVDTKTGVVIPVECDSFDIRDPDSGEHFPGATGIFDQAAPEYLSAETGNVYTEETDNFSLAVLIFRLLMRNADPFGGVITHQKSVSIAESRSAIMKGECAYVKHVPGKAIPWWAPTLDMLPSEIQDLFRKTFDYDASTAGKRIRERATAEEWCRALLPLASFGPNINLKRCSSVVHHVYPAGSSYCPWCKLMHP